MEVIHYFGDQSSNSNLGEIVEILYDISMKQKSNIKKLDISTVLYLT